MTWSAAATRCTPQPCHDTTSACSDPVRQQLAGDPAGDSRGVAGHRGDPQPTVGGGGQILRLGVRRGDRRAGHPAVPRVRVVTVHPIVQLIELAGNAPSSGSLAVAVRVADWHTANLALAGGDVMVTMGGRLPAGTVWAHRYRDEPARVGDDQGDGVGTDRCIGVRGLRRGRHRRGAVAEVPGPADNEVPAVRVVAHAAVGGQRPRVGTSQRGGEGGHLR